MVTCQASASASVSPNCLTDIFGSLSAPPQLSARTLALRFRDFGGRATLFWTDTIPRNKPQTMAESVSVFPRPLYYRPDNCWNTGGIPVSCSVATEDETRFKTYFPTVALVVP